MRVVDIDVEQTHDLRRQVLRDGRPEADVEFPGDRLPGAFHLGVLDDAALVGVASLCPEPTDHRPGRRAVRLRGMAVDPRHRGTGAGSALLAAAEERARAAGYEVVWANARDTALAFYERRGWAVAGEGFVHVDLPHHVALLDL